VVSLRELGRKTVDIRSSTHIDFEESGLSPGYERNYKASTQFTNLNATQFELGKHLFSHISTSPITTTSYINIYKLTTNRSFKNSVLLPLSLRLRA
jgi:hypothetical protein